MTKFNLKCRECGAEYPDQEKTVCDECFGPLKVNFNLDEAKKTLTKNKIKERITNLWRYFELLPITDKRKIVDIGAGYTPLIKAEKLGKLLGLKNLYIKNDSVNPTYSFKDRPVATGVSKVLEFGKEVISCASTGNLAASCGAYGVKAGLKTYVFIPASIEVNKISQIFAYGANVIGVNGPYDVANRLANEAADRWGWGVLNVNIRPWYAEGEKTIAFETIEQLGWVLPDSVIIPMGSGGLLCEVYKAFGEFVEIGLAKEKNVRFFGAQGYGASPIVDAFKNNSEIVPLKEPKTIAKSIAMGNPGDGDYALKIMRETKGGGENPNDDKILEGIRILAQTEGILTEPAGGVTIAALKTLAENGVFDKDECIVAYITGNGLKTQETIPTGKMIRVEPKIEEVERVVFGGG